MREVRHRKRGVNGSTVRGALASHLFIGAAILALLSTNQTDAQTCAPPPPNMVSWWPGDVNANDIEGCNDGTLSGGVTFAPGKVDQAFTFNGTDGEIILQRSSSDPLPNFGPSDSFTIDAWLKPDRSVLGTQR